MAIGASSTGPFCASGDRDGWAIAVVPKDCSTGELVRPALATVEADGDCGDSGDGLDDDKVEAFFRCR